MLSVSQSASITTTPTHIFWINETRFSHMLVFYLVFCICYISFLSLQAMLAGTFLFHAWLHQNYICFIKSVKALFDGYFIWCQRCLWAPHVQNSICKRKQRVEKSKFLFQKLQLSLVLSSQTPWVFLATIWNTLSQSSHGRKTRSRNIPYW